MRRIQNLRREKWIRRGILSAVGVGVLLVVLHLASVVMLGRMGELLLHPEPEKGFDPGQVDLNLFSGRLEVRGASLQRSGRTWFKLGRLDLDLDSLALLTGEIRVASLSIEDVWLRVEQTAGGEWLLPMPLPASSNPSAEAAPKRLPVGVNQLHVGNLTLHYSRAGVSEDLVLTQLDAGPYDMRLAEQQVPLQLALNLAGGSLALDGELELDGEPAVRGGLRIEGTDVARVMRLVGQAVSLQGIPRLDGKFEAAVDALKFEGKLDLVDLAFEQEGDSLAIGKLNLPAMQFDWNGQAQTVTLRLGEGVKARQLAFKAANHQVRLGQTAVDGRLALDFDLNPGAAPLAKLSVNADLMFDALTLSHAGLGDQRLMLEAIKLDGLQMTAVDQLTLKQVELKTLSMPTAPTDKAQPRNLASLRLADIRLQGTRLDMGDMTLTGLDTAVRNDAQAGWQLPLGQMATQGPASVEAPVTADKPELSWHLGSLTLKGENRIHFSDNTIKPAREKTLLVEMLELGPLDSDRPDADTPLRLSLLPDKYSQLDLEGNIRPLAEKPQLKLEGSLNDFDLAWVSPYAEPAMGHRILEGELSDDFRLQLDGSRVDMENNLLVRKIDVEALPPKEGQQTLPLKLGISLLQDREGLIKLAVPLQGDINDPDFQVLGVLNPIILKAIAGAATIAIQPVGSVLMIGSLVAGNALAVKFKPVNFHPGSLQPLAANDDYLEQLANKLQQRPGLKLRLCGIATSADLPEPETKVDPQTGKPVTQVPDQEAQLRLQLDLAKARSSHVRAQLVQRGVADNRLLSCRPKVDSQAGAEPQVQIGL